MDLRERIGSVLRFGLPGLQIYFDGMNGFAARSFDLLGRGPDIPLSSPTKITSNDLLALTLLDVRLPPKTVRELLSTEGERIVAELRSVEIEVLWDASDWTESGDLAGAWQAWRRLLELEDIGPVKASKILARLRPHLIPIKDSVIEDVLDYHRDNDWEELGVALDDPGIRGQLEKAQQSLGKPAIPFLRVLDAATWMLGGRSKRVKWALGRTVKSGWGSPPEERAAFAEARSRFWEVLPQTDPLERDL